MIRYVTIDKFADASGYTSDGIMARIKKGSWRSGEHYVRTPDGEILINTLAVPKRAPQPRRVAEGLKRFRAKAPTAPVQCGVYLLMLDGAVAYVGRSTTLKTRLATHRASGRKFDEARVIPCDEAASVWLEKELIRTLQPHQNLMRYVRHTEAAERALEGVE